MTTTNRKMLARLAYVVAAIERKQKRKPGYEQDILESIVNSELRRLEEEQARAEAEHAAR